MRRLVRLVTAALALGGGALAAGGEMARLLPAGCAPPAARAGAGRPPRCVLAFPQPVLALGLTPGASLAVVSVSEVGMTAWRLPAGEHVLAFAPPETATHAEAPHLIALAPDGRHALAALEGRLLRYVTASGRLERVLPGPGGLLRAVAWSPAGGRLLVTAFLDASAHLLRAADGREIRRLPVEREATDVAFAPGGRIVAVGSEAGSIALFALDRDEPPRVLAGSALPVGSLAFAGERLVSAGADGVLRVWDTGSGEQVGAAEVGLPVVGLAVGPRGTLVATAARDSAIRLHALPDGRVVETLAWHDAQVRGLAWAGNTLMSGDAAGRVALW